MAIVSPSAMARERVHKRYDVDDDSSPNLTIVQLCLLIAAIPRWLTCLLLNFIDRRRRRGMIAASLSVSTQLSLRQTSKPASLLNPEPMLLSATGNKTTEGAVKRFPANLHIHKPENRWMCSRGPAKMIFVASHESSQELFPMPFPLHNRNGHSEIH